LVELILISLKPAVSKTISGITSGQKRSEIVIFAALVLFPCPRFIEGRSVPRPVSSDEKIAIEKGNRGFFPETAVAVGPVHGCLISTEVFTSANFCSWALLSKLLKKKRPAKISGPGPSHRPQTKHAKQKA
jgi:hypothetical protein